mmetsp:Transcript_24779/g.73724  ORF Transcript_24779/g.73724 Transcript_24779/m.73724 type:complete len:540 (+) Transcript_24779:715-2334(+)
MVVLVKVGLLEGAAGEALHHQALVAREDDPGSHALLSGVDVHGPDGVGRDPQEDEVGVALDDQRLAAPLRGHHRVGEADAHGLESRLREPLLAPECFDEIPAVGVGDPAGAGRPREGVVVALWPRLAREAHVDEPLQDVLAGELREHAGLRRHHVAHLDEQHVRDLVVRLRADAALRVPHRKGHHLLRLRPRLRQRPPLQQQPAERVVLPPVRRRHGAHALRGVGAGEHAVHDAEPVGDHPVPVGLLDGVGHGVAVLEDHPAGLLVGVVQQDAHLGLDAQRQQLHERLVVQDELLAGAAVLAVHALLREGSAEAVRVLPAQQRGVLGELAEAREELAPRERPAERDVDEDLQRGVERADVVLPAVVADGGLQRGGDVVHREERRGDVHELRSAEQHGTEEAGEVHERAAAEGHDEAPLRGADLEGPAHEGREVVPGLAGVALRQHDLLDGRQRAVERPGARLARASPGQQGLEVAGVQGVHGLVAQEEDLVGLRLEQVRHHLGLYIDAKEPGHRGPVGEHEGDGLHSRRREAPARGAIH